MKHPDPLHIPLLTALSAHYTLADLTAAYRNDVPLSVAYWPEGKNGPRRRWRGIPSQDQIAKLRLLFAAAIGRTPAELVRCSTLEETSAPDQRSRIGSIYMDYEKIQTYKWTTDAITRKPIPPNSFAWRDLHTGKISVEHPMLKAHDQAHTA